MRKLFTVAAALSLLLFVATIVLWTRSRTCSDYWGLEKYKLDGAPLWEAGVQASGRVWVGFATFTGGYDPALRDVPSMSRFHLFHNDIVIPDTGGTPYPVLTRLGFGFEDDRGAGRTDSFIGLPYWFLCGTAFLLPALWSVQRLRRHGRQTRRGHCPTCGYDLRGTPIAARNAGRHIRPEMSRRKS